MLKPYFLVVSAEYDSQSLTWIKVPEEWLDVQNFGEIQHTNIKITTMVVRVHCFVVGYTHTRFCPRLIQKQKKDHEEP